tara:strand:- start:326 stop:610 length:285 start_codon:yes stop_codon:yes gene_type:complete
MRTQLLFNPNSLITSAKRIEGIELLERNVDEYCSTAMEVAEEWTEDHEEGDDFGSSDTTFALKDFLDRVIMLESFTKANDLKTVFGPRLTIVRN